jgi:hypothetical protein
MPSLSKSPITSLLKTPIRCPAQAEFGKWLYETLRRRIVSVSRWLNFVSSLFSMLPFALLPGMFFVHHATLLTYSRSARHYDDTCSVPTCFTHHVQMLAVHTPTDECYYNVLTQNYLVLPHLRYCHTALYELNLLANTTYNRNQRSYKSQR